MMQQTGALNALKYPSALFFWVVKSPTHLHGSLWYRRRRQDLRSLVSQPSSKEPWHPLSRSPNNHTVGFLCVVFHTSSRLTAWILLSCSDSIVRTLDLTLPLYVGLRGTQKTLPVQIRSVSSLFIHLIFDLDAVRTCQNMELSWQSHHTLKGFLPWGVLIVFLQRTHPILWR